MPSRPVLLLLALSLGAAPKTGGAQTAPDIRHYDLAITPDFAAGRVRITATLLIDNPAHVPEIAFLLSDRYADVRVNDGAAPVAAARDGARITARLDDPGELEHDRADARRRAADGSAGGVAARRGESDRLSRGGVLDQHVLLRDAGDVFIERDGLRRRHTPRRRDRGRRRIGIDLSVRDAAPGDERRGEQCEQEPPPR